ncbi:MAG: hypothetical protein ACRC3J_04370 [Culicoidibacterales bacterium]
MRAPDYEAYRVARKTIFHFCYEHELVAIFEQFQLTAQQQADVIELLESVFYDCQNKELITEAEVVIILKQLLQAGQQQNQHWLAIDLFEEMEMRFRL